MRSKFDGQLRKLNDEMISMGSMIEHAIQDAIDAFTQEQSALSAMEHFWMELDSPEGFAHSLISGIVHGVRAGDALESGR